MKFDNEQAHSDHLSRGLKVKQGLLHGIVKQQPNEHSNAVIQTKQVRPTFDMVYNELAKIMPNHVMVEVKRLKADCKGPQIVKLVGKRNFVHAMSVAAGKASQLRAERPVAHTPSSGTAHVPAPTTSVKQTTRPVSILLTQAQKTGLFRQFRNRPKAEQATLWTKLSRPEQEFMLQAVQAHAAHGTLNESTVQTTTAALDELSRFAMGELWARN